ncbi:MAG: UbiA family prenyltransferase [Flavobacteriales bacterium]|nr:UbiA family prenyltransferase [Flavobacteriales bacterium]
MLKLFTSIIKFFIYSNFFVALCVTAFTHLTYLIYSLPTSNLPVVLLMVFSFTFFTYNGQRLFRLRQKILQPEDIGERLKWVIKNITMFTIFSALFGIIGLVCTCFINPYCFFILIPMGGLSVFYVIPLIPFYKKSPSLRDIPYLKIIVIAITWSIAIVWLPFIDSKFIYQNINSTSFVLALFQVFLFVIAITLPFDVRDIKFDKLNHLKTIPQLIGSKSTIIFSELFLICSIVLLYNLLPARNYFYALFISHLITMTIIAFTNEKRKEVFFAGLVEGTVIILYSSVLISDLFF